MSTSETEKFIRTVCPHCQHETRTPNNFTSVIKFWKYETIEKPCADLMDCIRHLNQRIEAIKCSTRGRFIHCPHCGNSPNAPVAK